MTNNGMTDNRPAVNDVVIIKASLSADTLYDVVDVYGGSALLRRRGGTCTWWYDLAAIKVVDNC